MRTAFSLVLVIGLGLIAGCGASKSKIKGKIVKGGQAFSLTDKGVFVLSFVPESGGTTTFNATTKTDGTFEVVGPDGKGIPKGKYKVQLTAMDPYPQKDLLNGRYAPNAPNPMIIEVGAGELVVDVGK